MPPTNVVKRSAGPGLPGVGRMLGPLGGWFGFWHYVVRRFFADGALDLASSLSYTSLLSLVPLLAIGLAVMAAFPVFNGVRADLEATAFKTFVPEVGEQVQHYLSVFVANAGKLTAAGLVGLAVTAVMVLVTIETALNRIFRVVTHRSPSSRLFIYWTALTLGPLLLGAGISLSAWLTGSAAAAEPFFARLLRLGAGLAPGLLLIFAFGLLFVAVPNRRVRLADAAAGAVVAGLVMLLLRWGFGVYVSNAKSYQSIYGAVAAMPIFLFWMYLSWAVVLFGAELTAALPEWRRAMPDLGQPLPIRRRLALALNVLAALLGASRRGGGGCSRQDLLEAGGEREAALQDVIERLMGEGFVLRTAGGRFVLGRDLALAELSEIVHCLGLGLGREDGSDGDLPWIRRIGSRLAAAAKAQDQALALPLRAILEQAGSNGLRRLAEAHATISEEERSNP